MKKAQRNASPEKIRVSFDSADQRNASPEKNSAQRNTIRGEEKPIRTESMAFTIYSCKECGSNLNLNPNDLFPPDFYFEAGNKRTISFATVVDAAKFRFEKEDKIMPFFETLSYWGIHRNRTKIKCNSCGHLIGYIYDDGPPLTGGIGQYGFGPSQVIPRAPRYRFKTKSLQISSQT